MRDHVATIANAIALLGLDSVVAHAADPRVKCESRKLKETAKCASCRLKAKAVQTAAAANVTSQTHGGHTAPSSAVATRYHAGLMPLREGFPP